MDKDEDQEVIWTPTPRQAVALASPALDLFFGGARGGGKSDFLLFDWLSHAEQQGPVAGILFRRTLPELQEIETRAHLIFPQLGLTWAASTRTWTHPNGSYLRMRYLESVVDASRYQGHEYQWVGSDEAGTYPTPEVLDLMRGTLRTKRKGQLCLLRLTGNPGGPGHGWLKETYVEPAEPETIFEDPETGISRQFIPSRLEDNPHIQDVEKYKRNLRAAGAAHLVKAWLHGDWNIMPNGGVIRPDEIRQGNPPERERMRVYIGIDTASRKKDKTAGDPDYTAMVVIGVDPQRHLWILDVWREQTTTSKAWDALMKLCSRWDPETIWVEGGPIGQAVLPFWQDAQDRDGTWWNIKTVSHMGDKVAKAQALAAAIDRGIVHADKQATWWGDLRDEMTVFDGGDDRHDDQVDAAAIVARELRKLAAGKEEEPEEAPPAPRSRRALGLPARHAAPEEKGKHAYRHAFRQ